MPSKLALVLVAVIFLITVLVRLPASLLSALLPKDVQCQLPSGTIWQGACAQLRSGPLSLTDLNWHLHPLPLWRARAQLDVQSSDTAAAGQGSITLHTNGDVDIEALTASLPSQSELNPLPPGWSGQIELDIAHASIHQRALATIEGTITARQVHIDRPAADLGSFELSFPPSTPGVPTLGSLRDVGGPLALQGSLQLAGERYELNATLAARDPSNADLAKLLQNLGPADAQGRHEISLAGTF